MLFFNYVFSSSCPEPMDGLVLNHYVLKNCGACSKLEPVMDSILSRIDTEEIGLKYRKIECSKCECEGIAKFPTVTVTNDKKSIDSFVGVKKYDELAEWLANAIDIDNSILRDNHVKEASDTVKKLQETDFYKSFDGHWIILFYDHEKEPVRKSLEDFSKKHSDISFGEISRKQAGPILDKYGITTFPTILAFNHGVPVVYPGNAYDKNLLEKFINTLSEPSFENVSLKKLKEITEHYRNGEPIYVVLYKNYDLAFNYFAQFSNNFKFRAKIMRSDDLKMFEAANFFPEQKSENHNKLVKLFVYKNGTFFPSPFNVEDSDSTIHWIFHSHFPHLSEITSSTFYPIFHGLRPILLLHTIGEQFVEEFSHIANINHHQSPISHLLFATLDSITFPEVRRKTLHGIQVPSIVVFDPANGKWYYKENTLTSSNIKSVADETMKLFLDNKLPIYPPVKKTYIQYYAVLAIFGMLVTYFIAARMTSEKLIE